MSVKYFKNGQLNLIASAGGINIGGEGGNCDCDSKIFTGTAAEYEAQKDTIEDGTIINIIDDTLDGELLSTNVLNRVSDLEEDVEELKNNGAGVSNIVYLTQIEYDALPESKLTDDVEYRITDEGLEGTARNLSYDNIDSGIEAVNVQDAIDKLNDSLGEQPQFVYDETGKITGYTTKIGGADTVFPFSFSSNWTLVLRAKVMYNQAGYGWRSDCYGTFDITAKCVDGNVTISYSTIAGPFCEPPGGGYFRMYSFDLVSFTLD